LLLQLGILEDIIVAIHVGDLMEHYVVQAYRNLEFHGLFEEQKARVKISLALSLEQGIFQSHGHITNSCRRVCICGIFKGEECDLRGAPT
jgi:hypothetical protein